MNTLVQNPLAQALAWTLIHFLWEGLLLGLIAWGGLRLLRHRDANARYRWACACMGLMLLSALGTFTILRPIFHATGPLAPGALDAESFRVALTEAPWTTRAQAALEPILPWALVAWSLGVVVLTLRLAGAWLWLQRLRYSYVEPAGAEFQILLNALQRRLQVTGAVRLLKSTAVEAPVVIGWLRPVILVPLIALSGLSQASLEAILAHELAHIRRQDYLVNLLQSAVEILFFYHPAVWWLSARIRDERENACDDVAVSACGDARIYAESLTQMEELRADARAAFPALSLASNGGSLMNRIRRILVPPLPPSRTARVGLAAALAMSLLGAATTYTLVQNPAPRAEASKSQHKTRIVVRDHDKNVNVTMDGDVKVDAASKNLVKLGTGGSLELQVRDGAKVKKFSVRKDAKGEIREWTVDGKATPMTPADEAWLRDQLRELNRMESQAPRPERRTKKIIIERDGDSGVLDLDQLEDLPALGDESPIQKHREIRKIVLHSKRLAKEAESQAREAEGQARKAEGEARKAEGQARMHEGFRESEINMLRREIERLSERLERLQKREGSSRRPPRPPMPPAPPRPPAPPAAPLAPPPPPPPPPAPPLPPEPPQTPSKGAN